jgi:chromosome segregation ATPase
MEGKYTRIKTLYGRCFKADGELEIARWRVKMFTASDGKFVFKWQGSKKKKIEIVKDHDNDLLSRLKNNAHDDNKTNVTRENIDPNEHVLCAAMSLPLPSPTDNEREKDETFVDSYREIEEKLEMVLSRLSKLEEKSQSEKRAQSLLVAENNKMAAEITCLTTTVNELREENESIRTLLDNKQNEWIQVESRINQQPRP